MMDDSEAIGQILNGHGDWFSAKLFRLIAEADPENRTKLRLGFPEEVRAYELYHYGEAKTNVEGGKA
jgi:hypothetical protein